jgi:hypothetical protein
VSGLRLGITDLRTKQVIAGLAKKLDPDVRFLDWLAEEVRKDLAAK